MIEYLKQNGWSCNLCGCRGKKHYDCFHDKYKRVMVKVYSNNKFKVYRKSLLIKSGFYLSNLKIKLDEVKKEQEQLS